MDNFYKKIQSKLKESNKYPFDESQWDTLEQRLNQSKPNNNTTKTYKWPLLLLLLMLIGGGFYGSLLKEHQKEIANLTAQLSTKKQVNFDTTTYHHIVHLYDTVYHTVDIYPNNTSSSTMVISENIERFYPNQLTIEKNSKQQIEQHITRSDAIVENSKLSTFIPKISKQFNNSIPLEKSIPKPFNAKELYKALSPLNFTNKEKLLALPSKTSRVNSTNVVSTLNPSFSPTETRRLKRFRIGAILGTPQRISQGQKAQLGFVAGLSGEFNIGERFNFQIAGVYQLFRSKFPINNRKIDFSSLPEVMPINPTDEFLTGQVNFEAFDIPFGLKYYWWQKKRLHPYLGVGVVAEKTLSTTFNLEFRNSITSEDYSQSIFYQGGKFRVKTLYSSLGLVYNLNQDWLLLLGATYNYTPTKAFENTERYKAIRFETGILFEF